MSAKSEEPPRSTCLLRACLIGVAAPCGILSAASMIFFFWVLSLSSKTPYLLPITLVLLPVALVVIVMGCILWSISAALGATLYQLEGVYAKVRPDGLQLQSVHEANPRFIEWALLEEVLKIRYPLCGPYLLKLTQGSEVQVDSVDEELLKRHLKKGERPFKRFWGSNRQAYPG